jgi:hypothetical protein
MIIHFSKEFVMPIINLGQVFSYIRMFVSGKVPFNTKRPLVRYYCPECARTQ